MFTERPSVEDKFVTIDGLKLHYIKVGSGKPLLFLHGHRSDILRWIKVIERIAKKYTVYAPDLPGFGKSEQLKVPHKLKNFIPILAKFTQKIGLGKYTLLGGSMGGNVAVLLSSQNPQNIEKMVLISPLYNRSSLKIRRAKILSALAILRLLPRAHVYNFFDMFIKSDKLFKRLLRWRFPQEERTDEIIDYEARQWRVMSIRVWAETLRDLLRTDLSKFPKINIPSTVFLAGEDQYFKVDKEAEGFKKLLPNSKIIVIPKVPHVTKGEIPERILKKFDKYFKEI